MSKDWYNEGYPRKCSRCGADIHVPDPEHICKDILKRLERQERIIALIAGIISQNSENYKSGEKTSHDIAVEILAAINGKWEQD